MAAHEEYPDLHLMAARAKVLLGDAQAARREAERALALNLLSSLAMIVGAVLGYFLLQPLSGWINSLLAIAAASMIYVAVADLIPGLHKRPELQATLQQVVLIALGVGAIWVVGAITGA